jgi:hypothetical protein
VHVWGPGVGDKQIQASVFGGMGNECVLINVNVNHLRKQARG